jgi:hypothetical protein
MEYAAISDMDQLDVAIVCLRQGEVWEPVFYFKTTQGQEKAVQKQLPTCFELSDEAIRTLNDIWDISHAGSGEAS